jgi:hypothetical protein
MTKVTKANDSIFFTNTLFYFLPGTRTPFNLLTPVIDGNTIYGVDETFSRYLRSGFTGQLRMNPAFANLGLKELLPMKLNIPDEGCIRSNNSQYCFESG